MISQHPNGTYFLFHIGTGTPIRHSTTCAPGKVDPVYPFPSGHPEPAAATTHASDSLYGPWRPAPNVPGVNNPAVFFWSNGTTAIYDRTRVTWSDSIDGPWGGAVRCSFYGRIGLLSRGVLSVVVPVLRVIQLIIRNHFHLPSQLCCQITAGKGNATTRLFRPWIVHLTMLSANTSLRATGTRPHVSSGPGSYTSPCILPIP
jgi:hypothetical protein